MPARNAQNTIKTYRPGSEHVHASSSGTSKSHDGKNRCPACQTEVPPKPGFRPSSLKCPKCGSSLAKK